MMRAGITFAAVMAVALMGAATASAAPFTCPQPAPVTVPQDGTRVFAPVGCTERYSGTVIESHPRHGTLHHEPAGFGALRYEPDPGYSGPDHFSYRATDGAGFETDPLVQHVTVGSGDAAPECAAPGGTTLVREGTPRTFVLSCSDPDGTTPTVEIVDAPARGTLSAVGRADGAFTVTYTVTDPGGADSFSFRARDTSGATSATHVLRIDARSATYNTRPVCTDQALTVRAGDLTVVMPQACTDADGDRLTFAVVDPPTQGTATGTANSIAYTADEDATGTDTFTFHATDGIEPAVTRTATVTLRPRAVPDCFEYSDPFAATGETTRFRLHCGPGNDGLPVAFVLEDGPDHGTLTVEPNNDTSEDVLYRPNAGYTGTDSFTWHGVGPEGLRSPSRTFTFTVGPRTNAPPGCWGQRAIVVRQDATRVHRLDCGGAEPGDDLVIEIVSGPLHGELVDVDDADDGNLTVTYDPDDDYEGRDAFEFRVRDGRGGTSETRKIAIDVLRASYNRRPVCMGGGTSVPPGGTTRINNMCGDPDLDPITFELGPQPEHGTTRIEGTDVLYESTDATYNGMDIATFVVRDDRGGARTYAMLVQVGRPVFPDPGPGPGPGGPGGPGGSGGPSKPDPDPPAAPPPPAEPPAPTPPAPAPAPTTPEPPGAPQPRGLVPIDAVDLGASTGVFLPRGADDGEVPLRGARPAPLLVLTCALRCDVEATPRLVLSGPSGSARAVAVLRLPTQRLAIRAGGRAKLTVRLTRAQRRAVRRAGGASVRIGLRVRAEDGTERRDRTAVGLTPGAG